jgi:iron complex transport system substrate-binding protein
VQPDLVRKKVPSWAFYLYDMLNLSRFVLRIAYCVLRNAFYILRNTQYLIRNTLSIKLILNFVIILTFGFCALGLSLAASDTKPRYISLAPSTTEILFALGLDDEIVGVSSYCNYPPQAKNKAKAGDFSSPNMEQIFFLRPDYIFCTGLEQDKTISQLRSFKFKVNVSDPATVSELFSSIEEIGEITNKRAEAARLINAMKDDINLISSKIKLIPDDKKTRVFLEIWHEPLMTAGKGSFVDELISLAGGINIARDLTRPYSNFSAEKVVSLNPQCIILAYMDKEAPVKLLSARLGWDRVDAVIKNRVFNDIDPDILLRPGPRITKGLKELYKRLYSN